MHNILILLPTYAYFSYSLAIFGAKRNESFRQAFIKSHLVIFGFIAISTEILSSFNAITLSTFLVCWLLFLLVGTLLIFRYRGHKKITLSSNIKFSLIEKFFFSFIAFILATTLFTAIVYPPNTYDSMTYHMPRVLHWISNHNVSFYPTDIARQNYLMPLAEFAIMHLQLLTGGDIYANLVQWVNFIVLICLGAAVAEELGLDKKVQLLSALLIATLPMAILQASSTQNDLVVSVFLMSFAYFMLKLRTNFSVENLFYSGVSLGLALLTKGTAYIYGAAIGICLAILLMLASRAQLGELLKVCAGMASVVLIGLVLNTGFLWRTFQLYGEILPPQAEIYRNQDSSLAALGSTILKNAAVHLGTPNEKLNSYELKIIGSLLGEKIDDPKITLTESFYIPFSTHEDEAGNLIHMILIVASLILLPVTCRKGYDNKKFWYSMGIVLGAVLFCWTLKWQPWSSRLHTPLFALAAPLTAWTISSGIAAKRISYLIGVTLTLYSLSFVLNNESRSIISPEWKNTDRNRLYFSNWPFAYSDYKSAIWHIKDTIEGDVGLYMGFNKYEYPLWVLAAKYGRDGQSIKFRSVGVSDVSKILEKGKPLPNYVIATKPFADWVFADKYSAVYESKHLSVFKKLAYGQGIAKHPTGKNWFVQENLRVIALH